MYTYGRLKEKVVLVGCGYSKGIFGLFKPSQSRNKIEVMYHDQIKFALILTVKRNDPATLSKHKATCRKKNKEIGNNNALSAF